MTKVLIGLGVLVALIAVLLFIDRPFVRLVVTAAGDGPQPTMSGPWVQIENRGVWDATSFGFACSVAEAKDANGAVVIERRSNGSFSFLMAEGGELAAGENRRQICSVQPEAVAGKVAQAEMRGMAFFGVRYLPLSRVRDFRILLKRDAQNRLQVVSAEPI